MTSKSNKTPREIAQTWTKAELLQLMDEIGLWHKITRRHLILAKIEFLMKKSEEAFAKYIAIQLPDFSPKSNFSDEYLAVCNQQETAYRIHKVFQVQIKNLWKQLSELRETQC